MLPVVDGLALHQFDCFSLASSMMELGISNWTLEYGPDRRTKYRRKALDHGAKAQKKNPKCFERIVHVVAVKATVNM